MRLTHPLDDLFAGPSHVRILRALEEVPDGLTVSAREVARRSGLSHPTASSVLASLRDLGIVVVGRKPGIDGFELNRRHVAVQQLGPLFEWERQLPSQLLTFLRREIEREAPVVSGAYLFGSAARGEMTPASDIDLAIIVPKASNLAALEPAIDQLTDAVQQRFGNRLNVTVGSSPPDELRRPGRKGHRLWTKILTEGIPVIDRRQATRTGLRQQRSIDVPA